MCFGSTGLNCSEEVWKKGATVRFASFWCLFNVHIPVISSSFREAWTSPFFLAGVFRWVLIQGSSILWPVKMGTIWFLNWTLKKKSSYCIKRSINRVLSPILYWQSMWMFCTSLVMCWRAITRDEFSNYHSFNPWQIFCVVNKGAINANYEEFCDVGISVVLAWGLPSSFQKGHQSSYNDYQLLLLGCATCWEFP